MCLLIVETLRNTYCLHLQGKIARQVLYRNADTQLPSYNTVPILEEKYIIFFSFSLRKFNITIFSLLSHFEETVKSFEIFTEMPFFMCPFLCKPNSKSLTITQYNFHSYSNSYYCIIKFCQHP